MTTAPHPLTRSSEEPRKQRVLLVEDHPITRQGLTALINAESGLQVCGETDSSAVAMDLTLKLQPDVALVDITLKTTSGIELMKNLRALRPDMPVLMMSMHDEALFAERAMKAGAKGYVMKNEPGKTILAALRRVLEGELYLSDKMKEKMLRRLANTGRHEIVFSIDTLSDRQMEVFQLIGDGYGTRQIAERLKLSVKTIDSYREQLKLKLQLASGADLVQHAIQWSRTQSVA